MNIEKELQDIKKDIHEIRQLLNTYLPKLSSSCSKMDEHIVFVDGAYENFKYPLNYIKNKIDYISGVENKCHDQLKDN